MAKRKWTCEEIEEFRETHGWIYFNREDLNLFVPKRLGFGYTLNFAHPVSWIFIAVTIGLIIWKLVR
ncbi:MAG: DUF5808 domain-containing protein [Bacillota bacterium]|nr:DUF5808 domain-containing protein [Bacillota bacterium]